MMLFCTADSRNARWNYLSFCCYLKLASSVCLKHFLSISCGETCLPILCMSCLARCDWPMGAHTGSGPEQGAENETEPPEVAAVQLWPQQHLDLARGDGGGAGAATAPGAQHWHPVHRAANKEAQGSRPRPSPGSQTASHHVWDGWADEAASSSCSTVIQRQRHFRQNGTQRAPLSLSHPRSECL